MSIKENLPLIEEIKEIFTQIQNIDPGSLIREEELGKSLSFSDYFDDFVRIINFYKRLTYLDISSLPTRQLTTIKYKATTFLSYINSIQSFTVDANNAMPQRDAVASNLINSYQDDFDELSPIITYCEKEGTDYQALQIEVNKIVEDINIKSKKISEDFDSKMLELNNTLEAARKAAHEVGITQHTVNFEEASKKYKCLSNWWLSSIVITGALIIFLSLFLFNSPIQLEPDDPYASYRFIQAAIARFTALFTALILLFWEVRNYNAAQHNYTINQNKQNSLSTFETFVSAARDEETKNAVLMQTTKAIFSNLPSGYLKNESGDDGSSQIIEIARGIGSKVSN
jgi:hypothetical protein